MMQRDDLALVWRLTAGPMAQHLEQVWFCAYWRTLAVRPKGGEWVAAKYPSTSAAHRQAGDLTSRWVMAGMVLDGTPLTLSVEPGEQAELRAGRFPPTLSTRIADLWQLDNAGPRTP